MTTIAQSAIFRRSAQIARFAPEHSEGVRL